MTLKFKTMVSSAGVLLFAASFAVANAGDKASSSSSTTSIDSSTSKSGDLRSGHDYQVIQFRKGSADLSQASKDTLKTFVKNVKESSDISRLEIAVWADKAFPSGQKAQDLSRADRDLVQKRIDGIKSFMDEVGMSDVNTYSMAERSNWFARALNTREAELKSLFSQQGAPVNVQEEHLKMVKKQGGPMKAVILAPKAEKGSESSMSQESSDEPMSDDNASESDSTSDSETDTYTE